MSLKFHVKRGDFVTVISGAHKGKSGKILEILPAKQRVKHNRPLLPLVMLVITG